MTTIGLLVKDSIRILPRSVILLPTSAVSSFSLMSAEAFFTMTAPRTWSLGGFFVKIR